MIISWQYMDNTLSIFQHVWDRACHQATYMIRILSLYSSYSLVRYKTLLLLAGYVCQPSSHCKLNFWEYFPSFISFYHNMDFSSSIFWCQAWLKKTLCERSVGIVWGKKSWQCSAFYVFFSMQVRVLEEAVRRRILRMMTVMVSITNIVLPEYK